MNLENLIGFPLENAKNMIGKQSFSVETTGEEIAFATLVVTNAKWQENKIVFTCAWFNLNVGG